MMTLEHTKNGIINLTPMIIKVFVGVLIKDVIIVLNSLISAESRMCYVSAGIVFALNVVASLIGQLIAK
jgi:hypothetical protein